MSSLDISAYLPVRSPVEIRGSSFPDLGRTSVANLPQASPNDAWISVGVTVVSWDARLGRDNKSKGSWRIW